MGDGNGSERGGGGGSFGKSVNWRADLSARLRRPDIQADAVWATKLSLDEGCSYYRAERTLKALHMSGAYNKAKGLRNGKSVSLYWPK